MTRDALLQLFRRFDFPVDDDWRPETDDWMRLALGLAFKHAEPGFAFPEQSDVRPAEEAEWIRDVMMDNRYLERVTRNGKTFLSGKRRGVTLDAAARQTERDINSLVAAGELPPSAQTGKRRGARNGAGSIKTAYSTRRKALQREAEKDLRDARGWPLWGRRLPPSVRYVLDLQETFLAALRTARELSWPRPMIIRAEAFLEKRPKDS